MKIIYLMLAFISLALGTIGAFLPVLPTVPFLLLSSYLFAKGSDRYHRWFVQTKIYKKYLQDFSENRAMTLQAKLTILIPVSVLLIIVMFISASLHLQIFIGVLMVIKYYYFIFKIETIHTPKQKQEDIVNESK